MMTQTSDRELILSMIQKIQPFDGLEQHHIKDTVNWIKSGKPIFRTKKPDIPPKHLVSYFVVFDENEEKILLVDHKKSQLWLPPGGHVEQDEHPQETVRRECFEELKIEAKFWQETPLFLTSTLTVGLTAGHTDVSFWYVLKGNHRDHYEFDEQEFNSIQWFKFTDIPFDHSDPHMKRFITKLKRKLTGEIAL
ncbi:NUDIX hydrolase [Candidatus Nucleicultrix amoebiphila]|jgi:8-oxo-dGTP pyrophosphatase MutT (NUDIX family)|nr:NUDIX hydrolase [Candidatus Nucleicultrix amoebiphila]